MLILAYASLDASLGRAALITLSFSRELDLTRVDGLFQNDWRIEDSERLPRTAVTFMPSPMLV